jgi:hypothetical protein
LDRHHSEAIDYLPAYFRKGLEAPRWAPLDLQKGSSNIELNGDHDLALSVSDHLRRRCYFHVAVRTIFGEANRTMDIGTERGAHALFDRQSYPGPIKIKAIVSLKLSGAMQLIQVPMIVGASYTAAISLCLPLDGP